MPRRPKIPPETPAPVHTMTAHPVVRRAVARTAFGVVILLVGGIIATGWYLDQALARMIETVGSRVTGVDVQAELTRVAFLSGEGDIRKLTVDDPGGNGGEPAVTAGHVRFLVRPFSLLRHGIQVRSVKLEGVEVSFRGDLEESNLEALRNQLEAFGLAGETDVSKRVDPDSRRFLVETVVVAGGKVHVTSPLPGEQTLLLNLPDFEVPGPETADEGWTTPELFVRVLDEILSSALVAVRGELGDDGGVPGTQPDERGGEAWEQESSPSEATLAPPPGG